ncbi:hypothetical protein [Bacillus sp. JCM 19041]
MSACTATPEEQSADSTSPSETVEESVDPTLTFEADGESFNVNGKRSN